MIVVHFGRKGVVVTAANLPDDVGKRLVGELAGDVGLFRFVVVRFQFVQKRHMEILELDFAVQIVINHVVCVVLVRAVGFKKRTEYFHGNLFTKYMTLGHLCYVMKNTVGKQRQFNGIFVHIVEHGNVLTQEGDHLVFRRFV
jgi:hypothetical protein